MASTSTVRLFVPDKWVGPKLNATKLDKSLLAIKPKNTKVVVKTKQKLWKKEGHGTVGVAYSNGQNVIYVCPSIEKEELAHEFGHIAYGHHRRFGGKHHRSPTNVLRREIAANIWAEEHWAKPNNIKTGTYKERKRWLASVSGQHIYDCDVDPLLAVRMLQKNMRYFGLNPLTPNEYQYVVRETNDWAKRRKGWEPKWEPKWTLKNAPERWYK